jgi:hypothetical protein
MLSTSFVKLGGNSGSGFQILTDCHGGCKLLCLISHILLSPLNQLVCPPLQQTQHALLKSCDNRYLVGTNKPIPSCSVNTTAPP